MEEENLLKSLNKDLCVPDWGVIEKPDFENLFSNVEICQEDQQDPDYPDFLVKSNFLALYALFFGIKEKINVKNFREISKKITDYGVIIDTRLEQEDFNKWIFFLGLKKEAIKDLVFSGLTSLDDIETELNHVYKFFIPNFFARHFKRTVEFFLSCFNEKKPVPENIAFFLKKEFDIKYIEEEDNFYFFSNETNQWEEITKEEIGKIVFSFDASIKVNPTINEVLNKLKSLCFIKKRKIETNLIPCKNGLYNLNTKEFRHYKKEDFILPNQKLNAEFDPSATCEEIDRFFSDLVETEKEKELLYEIVAYSLLKENPHSKAFLFVGSGANGKSTYLNLLNKFFGAHNVSALTLQTIELNRFALANLEGKYLNVFADLPYNDIKTLGVFKSLTGGDFITAEKKFRQKPISFYPSVKLIFSANKLPKIYDDSDAVFRRLIILKFNKVFLGENADPEKLKKITTPYQLSGLLNEALKRVEKVREKGFSYSLSIEEIRTEYENNSNSIAFFINERIEKTQEEKVFFKEETYLTYVNFCNEKKVIRETKDKFFKHFDKEMARKGLNISTQRITDGEKRRHAFIGYFEIEGYEKQTKKEEKEKADQEKLV